MFTDQYVPATELRPGDVVEVDGRQLTVTDAFQDRAGSFVVQFTRSAWFGLPNRSYRIVSRATIPA